MKTSRKSRCVWDAPVEAMERRLLFSASTVPRTIAPQVRPIAVVHYLARPTAKVTGVSGHPSYLGSSQPFGYSPQQMRSAYAVDAIRFGSVVGDGSGQTIAIVDAYDDPNALADLNAF